MFKELKECFLAGLAFIGMCLIISSPFLLLLTGNSVAIIIACILLIIELIIWLGSVALWLSR